MQPERDRTRLLPTFLDFFVIALVIWTCVAGEGWKSLVQDGDTGWHIRTGEHILRTGTVPASDLFSYTKAGQPWFAWEWLADVIFAGLHGRFGLAGVAALAGLLSCATAVVLLRTMVWRGVAVFAALALTLVATGASLLHQHARPHLFTTLLLAVFVWVVQRDRQQPGARLWLLVPMVAVWTNLHGGFLVAVAYAGLVAVGAAAEEALGGREWKRPLRYLALAAACLAASLANPFGYKLHVHIAAYLRSDFIQAAVQEFQSPKFRGETALYYEVLLLAGLLVAGLLLRRRRFADALPVLYFAHMSLTSARHIPLYVIVAAPLVALELTEMWQRFAEGRSKKSLVGILDAIRADFDAGFRRLTPWCAVGVAALVLSTPAQKWPVDFEPKLFPTRLVAQNRNTIVSAERVFTTDQWGDYLLYHFWPKTKVFIDGRSDFYGPEHCKEYIALLNLEPQWKELLAKHGFDAALIPAKSPLVSALKMTAGWRVVAEDSDSVLFSLTRSAAAENSTVAGLMQRVVPAEGTRRDPTR